MINEKKSESLDESESHYHELMFKGISKLGPKQINTRFFKSYLGNGIVWFRIFGHGLHWKDTTRHPLLFSERYGYSKALKIGNWRISYLK